MTYSAPSSFFGYYYHTSSHENGTSCNSLSIGIGHPRSGDRCAETRPYPLDPLRVAEQ